MNLAASASHLFRAGRERGIAFFWTYFVESIWFDLRRGTRTSTRVPKSEQQIGGTCEAGDDGLLYVASFTSVIRNAIRMAEDLIGDEDAANSQFVDLGCGKGKALLVYAECRRVTSPHPAIGIEYDADLAGMAARNCRKRGLDSSRCRVVADSAVNVRQHLEAPVAIVYLYNSFQGETLRAVLHELHDLPHVLVYVDPVELDLIHASGYEIHEEHHGRYNADTWVLASRGLPSR